VTTLLLAARKNFQRELAGKVCGSFVLLIMCYSSLGVLNYIKKHKKTLPVKERYIHAAISKGNFKLVVTLNPQL